MNDQHSSDQQQPHEDSAGTTGTTGTTGGSPGTESTGNSTPTTDGPANGTADGTPAARPTPDFPSVLDSVVVHAVGAVCRRRARVTLPPDGRLRLTGLPKHLDAHSLRARILVGPAGTAVTEARLEAVAELRDPSELPGLRRRLEEADERVDALREQHRLVVAAVAETTRLRAVPPQRRRDELLRRTPADAWLELAEFVDERLTGLQLRAERLTREIELAEHEVQVLNDQVIRSSTADRFGTVGTTTTALLTLTTTGAETTGAENAGGTRGTRGTGGTEGAGGTAAGDPTPLDIELEYTVRAARWVPSYRLSYRQGADTGRLLLRASVAQRTGEDWTGVRLALSTADLDRRTDLPELRSLRIGRSQPAPPPSGWREPPPGLSDLFTGYDAAGPAPFTPSRVLVGAAAGGAPGGAPEHRLAVPVGPAVAAAPLPPPLAAPAPQAPGSARARVGGLRSADEPTVFAGYGAPAPAASAAADHGDAALARFAPDLAAESGGADFAPPPGPPVPDDLLLDYPALELLGPEAGPDRRGTLHRPSRQDPYGRPAHDSGHRTDHDHGSGTDLRHLPLPRHAVPPRVSAGSFDHRFDAAAPADLPSDGTWHTVTIDEIPVSVRPEYVTVPAVEEQVYATLVITNGTDRAVLAGPAEVTVDDRFLLTAALPTLAPGGVRRLGTGVAESVEVTRRTELRESTAGMLNSSTVLDHRVHVELANRLGRPVTVEVRERVPVSSDADIRIEERPGWHAPDEPSAECPAGTRLRRVELPPGGRAELDGGYQIRIPAGKAIVGGNRRN
ncbi:DUF4139 domain-containing protein [Kitasatospora sp. NPDC056327]|uniref:DUF4139 domain-containing protein n=1 Tax=Kitasatospora sp. NPDC056327 TaxID=3345785 RepID=UPI0035DBEE64